MARNKLRLQLALYVRPKHPGTYHNALLVVPKTAAGPTTKHHVKNALLVDESGHAAEPWRYEKTTVTDIQAEQRILVRAIVGKVTVPSDELERITGTVSIPAADYNRDNAEISFDCRTWFRDVFEKLLEGWAVVSKLSGWKDAERRTVDYLDRKRNIGRWDSGWKGKSGVALIDLLDDKEFVA